MIEFTKNAVIIGNFSIYYYGIILMSGVVAAAFLANSEAVRKKKNTEFLWDSLIWIVLAGVLGARLWHVFTPPPSMVERGITTYYYLTHPLDALNPRLGGLGIPGAVIGGVLALYWYSKKRKQKFLVWADIIAPAVPLGQAIGRFGNFVNQEVYGSPTDLPWGIFIEPANRLAEFMEFEKYHPIFLYEALWNLASVFFLLWVARKFSDRLKDGDVFLLYLISYPFIRIMLDFLRLDASEIAGINANQTLMAVVMLASATILFLRHRPAKNKK